MTSISGRFGPLGAGFIEAHHLKPVASLEEGAPVDTSSDDFAVLSSNCHRMIRRTADPSDLEESLPSSVMYDRTREDRLARC